MKHRGYTNCGIASSTNQTDNDLLRNNEEYLIEVKPERFETLVIRSVKIVKT